MRTKIKICGITNIEDALAASKLDIDYIGLIFISESPRCVSITTAEKICKNIHTYMNTFNQGNRCT